MKTKLTPVLYLISATIILATALYINHQADTIKAQAAEVERAAHLQAVEVERERTKAELDQQTEQLQQVEQRNAELEELLINRARTYAIVTEGIAAVTRDDVQLLSRSGRQQITAVNMPLISKSGFTAAALDRAFAEMAPGMSGTGEAFVAAEEHLGINALVLAGICHLESGGGTSGYAQRRHNLAGLGAYTSNPDYAFYFDSKADSIFYLAELLAVHYTPGGRFYGGSFDLQGIGVRYACDPVWAFKVAGRMEQIARAAVGDPAALMAAAQNTYGGEL